MKMIYEKLLNILSILLFLLAIIIALVWNIELFIFLGLGIIVWFVLRKLSKNGFPLNLLINFTIIIIPIYTIVFDSIANNPNAIIYTIDTRLYIFLLFLLFALLSFLVISQFKPTINDIFKEKPVKALAKGIGKILIFMFLSLLFYTLGLNPTFQYFAEVEMIDDNFVINETINLSKFGERSFWQEDSNGWEISTKVTQKDTIDYAIRKREIPTNSNKIGLFTRRAIIPMPVPRFGVLDYRDSKVILILPKNCFLESKQSILEKKNYLDKEYITLSANFENTTEPREIEFTYLPKYFRFEFIRQISLSSFSSWIDKIIFIVIGVFVASISDKIKSFINYISNSLDKKFKTLRKKHRKK